MNKTLLLLIEDNPLLTGMYQEAFEGAGFEVLVAHDGETGLGIAKEKRPDGIILDILMPDMDGYKVLEELKKDPATKNIKVIALTVVSAEKDQEKAKKMGAVDYLIKTDLTLGEIVKRVVDNLHKTS